MKLKDDRKETTEQWISRLLKESNRYKQPQKIASMAKIWDWLIEHDQYDYTIGDIRKGLYNIPSRSMIQDAIFELQILGLVRQYRQVGPYDTFQHATWKPLA